MAMMTITGTILDVRVEEIDGRDQLVIICQPDHGSAFKHVLSREDARTLTRALGPHPVVEKFFRDGKGLQ